MIAIGVGQGPSGPSQEGPGCRDKILSVTKFWGEKRGEREKERDGESELKGLRFLNIIIVIIFHFLVDDGRFGVSGNIYDDHVASV